MLESNFQAKLVKELKELFPGCVVLKNDAQYKDSIPDLTILYKDKYALLECKRSREAMEHCLKTKQRNQKWWIDHFNEMGGYANYIFPENKYDILIDLKEVFK